MGRFRVVSGTYPSSSSSSAPATPRPSTRRHSAPLFLACRRVHLLSHSPRCRSTRVIVEPNVSPPLSLPSHCITRRPRHGADLSSLPIPIELVCRCDAGPCALFCWQRRMLVVWRRVGLHSLAVPHTLWMLDTFELYDFEDGDFEDGQKTGCRPGKSYLLLAPVSRTVDACAVIAIGWYATAHGPRGGTCAVSVRVRTPSRTLSTSLC